MGLAAATMPPPIIGSQRGRLLRMEQRQPHGLDSRIEALRDDPVAFARAGGIDPDPWQADVLRQGGSRILLNCSRQCGKSAVVSVLSMRTAIYTPRALVVVIAQAQRQAMEMIRACRDIYAALGRPVRAESENKLSLELDNGSRILSLPSTEATIRGFSKVSLLVMDEASRIPDSVYAAALPFLATSNGTLALLSTPFGRRGFFFDAYQHRDEWFYREVPAASCPRIPASFLEEARRKTGDYFYSQEYACAFNDSATGAFHDADIERAVRDYPRWHLRSFVADAPDGAAVATDDTTMPMPMTPDSKESLATWNTWNLQRYATR